MKVEAPYTTSVGRLACLECGVIRFQRKSLVHAVVRGRRVLVAALIDGTREAAARTGVRLP